MGIESIWDIIDRWESGQDPASQTRLRVTTSPNVELMLVVAMLAAPTPSPGHYGTLEHPIAQAARNWFAPYLDHPAVAAVRRFFYGENEFGSGFSCDAVTSFILRRSGPPGLAARYPYAKSVLACADSDIKALDLLIEQLRHFYNSSRFESFREEHAGAYQKNEVQISNYIEAGWAGEDVIGTMESYFGEARKAYILLPTPMERPAGGTLEVMGDEDSYILACLDSTVDKEWVLHLLYHEFGHSFVNPLAEQHDDLVKQYAGLYPALKDAMRPWGYVNWTIALNEHILRAQNCRLRRRLLGDAAAEAQLVQEETQGFSYIRALESKLAEYEARRDEYPALADFYPLLVTALDAF